MKTNSRSRHTCTICQANHFRRKCCEGDALPPEEISNTMRGLLRRTPALVRLKPHGASEEQERSSQ